MIIIFSFNSCVVLLTVIMYMDHFNCVKNTNTVCIYKYIISVQLYICHLCFLDVNIGFQQTQYTINDQINSSLNICIQLTEGSLERDVTVKVGTETTSNTTGTQAMT